MKKHFKLMTVLLSMTFLLSSCIGSFNLTNKVKDWNSNLGNKFVNELVFIGMHIIPVYSVTIFVDAVVLNSIEFWSGNSPISKKENGTKVVKNSKGEDVMVTSSAEGYTFSNGEEAVKLTFDATDNSWSVVSNDVATKLLTIDSENNTAEFYMHDGKTMAIELTEDGVNAVRQEVSANSFAAK